MWVWVSIPEPLLKKSPNFSKMRLEDGKIDVNGEAREITADLKNDVRINKLNRENFYPY